LLIESIFLVTISSWYSYILDSLFDDLFGILLDISGTALDFINVLIFVIAEDAASAEMEM